MSSFCIILLSALACIGVVLIIRGLCRFLSARRASYICLCFDKALLEGGKPDMVIICRSDAEEDADSPTAPEIPDAPINGDYLQ